MQWNRISPIEELKPLLPRRLRDVLEHENTDFLEEIRVRINRPIQLIFRGKELTTALVADSEFMENLLRSLTQNSAYSHEYEIKQGYISLKGGSRAGICGKTVIKSSELSALLCITSVNIRIAREILGCAAGVISEFTDEKRIRNVLIISRPGVGKTTLLRDIARLLSDGDEKYRGLRVCMADERGELSGAYSGVPTLDIGLRTDVMCGCPKAIAMERMLRTMSPEVIITDEIGNEQDALAIKKSVASGVSIIASAHAGNYDELINKPELKEILDMDCFERIILLKREKGRLAHETFSAKGELL